ncbi:MAG: VRR-NUC domain-containing protein [Halobacteriales archaeon]
MFRPTDDACTDCGDAAFAVTDSVPSESRVPLCFACYVDRLDRVRACGVVEVEVDEGAGEFVVGAPSVSNADQVARSVVDEIGGTADTEVETVAPLPEARDLIGEYHARELARAERSESRHVYAATGRRGSVVDTETRTDSDTRDALTERLARRAVDHREIRKRADVADAVATTLPTLAEHGAARLLGVEERVWEHAKIRGVSEASERAARNQDAGREFEEAFIDWCDDHSLDIRGGKEALVRLYPDITDEVARKTDGLAGVPDFLVRDNGQRSFGDGWRPDGEAFVEVKRGTSSLSREQERVVAHLKSHGFDVFVLRGEPDDLVFERR